MPYRFDGTGFVSLLHQATHCIEVHPEGLGYVLGRLALVVSFKDTNTKILGQRFCHPRIFTLLAN